MIFETTDQDYTGYMKRLIDHRSASLLDVGAGICRVTGEFQVPIILALEVHRPYLEHRVNRAPHIIPLNIDALRMNEILLPKSVSSVLLSDVIEHFNKQDALKLIRLAEEIAVDRVVLSTPRGFFPQENFDYYAMQGETYQTHRSGWEPEELEELGYQVIVMKELNGPENISFLKAYGPNHPRTDALIAFKEFGGGGARP